MMVQMPEDERRASNGDGEKIRRDFGGTLQNWQRGVL